MSKPEADWLTLVVQGVGLERILEENDIELTYVLELLLAEGLLDGAELFETYYK